MSRRARFTPRQRLILTILATAVVVVFGLLGYSVYTTIRHISPPESPVVRVSPTRAVLSPLSTATTSSVELSVTVDTLTPTVTLTAPLSSTPTITPTVTPEPSPTPEPLSPLQSARFVQEVGRIVAGLRDLPIGQIPVSFPTRQEVSVSLLQRYQTELPQEGLALYMDLGVIPMLSPLPLPDVGDQAANLSSQYIPDEQQIVIVASGGPTTPDDETALAHALANALQDQQYGLATLTACQSTTDAEMALQALVQGDPVLVAALYAEIETDWEQVDQLARMVADAQEPSFSQLAENAIYERLRLFPYREGAYLVSRIVEEGGWAAVDQAYARPPCSSEQVLHPERFLTGEVVQALALPHLGDTLGEGWILVRQDTLGEFIIGLHLAAHLDDLEEAWNAAQGWAGDSFAVWEYGKGEYTVTVWRLAWDDVGEAAAFERGYALLIPRFRVPPPIASDLPDGLTGRIWDGPAGAAYLTRAGRIVTVIWGPDVETVTDVARVMP